jgi:hypothetical protein
LTGESNADNERSGTEAERLRGSAVRPSTVDFLFSDRPIVLSSFAVNCVAAIERFDEPEVEAVESDDDDVWEG